MELVFLGTSLCMIILVITIIIDRVSLIRTFVVVVCLHSVKLMLLLSSKVVLEVESAVLDLSLKEEPEGRSHL